MQQKSPIKCTYKVFKFSSVPEDFKKKLVSYKRKGSSQFSLLIRAGWFKKPYSDWWLKVANGSWAIVGLREGQIIGWSVLETTSFKRGDHFVGVFVPSEFRGNGFGKKLLRKAKKVSQFLGGKTLHGRPNDTAGKKTFSSAKIISEEVYYDRMLASKNDHQKTLKISSLRKAS